MNKSDNLRLAAIYIPEGVLSHVFGKDHKGQTINLGGRHLYSFKGKDIEPYFEEKEKHNNISFIEKFWLNNIKLISAIVGENGIGKTSILNLFKGLDCKYIYEDIENNEVVIKDDCKYFEVIYYSAFLNINQKNSENDNFRDLSKYSIMTDDTGYEEMNITELLQLHNSENLKRWISFIELKNVHSLLKEIALPSFSQINFHINSISITEHQTSYNFRPFFRRLHEMVREETAKREQNEFERLELTKSKIMSGTNASYKIRLEQEILNRVIDKTQNILEGSGNKYLDEGHLLNNYTVESEEFTSQKDSRSAFYWFLDNSYIILNKTSKRILFPKKQTIDLIEVLLSSLPEAEIIENWSEWNVDFKNALKILDVYEKYLLSFKENFVFDRKPLLGIKPFINLSSGEKGLYDLFSVLNDLNNRFKNKIYTDFGHFNKREKVSKNLLLLLDEGDLGFHPEWKKKYLNSIQQIIPFIFQDKNIQIIITTHDPLTLSDFPKGNIVYLKKDKEVTIVQPSDGISSFGANVTDLLKNSFFIKDGLIGDFAKNKIENIIIELNKLLNIKMSTQQLNVKTAEKDNIKKTISIIDEPIVQQKLIEMYNAVFEDAFSIDNEISRLEEELNNLRKIKSQRND